MGKKKQKNPQNVINFLVGQKFIHFLKHIYYTYYLYVCIQKLSNMLGKGLRKNIKKKEKMENLEIIS